MWSPCRSRAILRSRLLSTELPPASFRPRLCTSRRPEELLQVPCTAGNRSKAETCGDGKASPRTAGAEKGRGVPLGRPGPEGRPSRFSSALRPARSRLEEKAEQRKSGDSARICESPRASDSEPAPPSAATAAGGPG